MSPRPPHPRWIPALPRWIGVDGLAMVTVAALVACGIGAIQAMTRAIDPPARWASTVLSFALGAFATRIVLRGAPSSSPYGRSLFVGILVGPVGGVLLLAADAFFTASRRDFGIVVVLGAFIGLAIGPLLALLSIPLTVAARGWRMATPHDTFDRALGINGVVLLLLGLLVSLLQSAKGETGWDGAFASALGAVFFACLAVRDLARRRWLAKVAAHALPQWSLEAKVPDSIEMLAPFVRATPGDAVLTFATAAAPDGPFRGGGAAARIAQLDVRAATSHLLRRSLVAALGIAIALGGQGQLYRFRAKTINETLVTTPDVPTPVRALERETVAELAAALGHACVRVSDGTLRCWGNDAGSLLASARVPSRTPTEPPGVGAVEAMAIGSGTMCVLRKVGESRALCWGANEHGELGADRPGVWKAPTEIGPPNVVEVALSHTFTLAVTKDGQVHRWGNDPSGYTSYPYQAHLLAPAVVPGLTGIVHVAAGSAHACAIDRDGALFCWGEDREGQASGVIKEQKLFTAPVRIALPGRVTALSLNRNATWARVVAPDGHAIWWAWGGREVWSPIPGAVFEGSPNDASPRIVPGTESIAQVRQSYARACGLRGDGSISCWRNNTGDGIQATHGVQEVLPPGSALDLEGYGTYCARGTKTVWCWSD